MNSLVDNLISHIVETLPDSISARIKALSALLAIVPKTHRSHQRIVTMLAFLTSHERQQMEFNLSSGNGNGNPAPSNGPVNPNPDIGI